MNLYYATAGIFITITGFVHMILGERWLFSKLSPSKLQTHYSGDVTKTTLRWFWHVGSFIVFFVGTVSLLMAFTQGIVPDETFVGKLLATIYLGINGILLLLHVRSPAKLKEYPQLIIMLFIMVLLYLGSNQ